MEWTCTRKIKSNVDDGTIVFQLEITLINNKVSQKTIILTTTIA